MATITLPLLFLWTPPNHRPSLTLRNTLVSSPGSIIFRISDSNVVLRCSMNVLSVDWRVAIVVTPDIFGSMN